MGEASSATIGGVSATSVGVRELGVAVSVGVGVAGDIDVVVGCACAVATVERQR